MRWTVILWKDREKRQGIQDKTGEEKRWGTKIKGARGYWRANQCKQSGRFMYGSSSKRRSWKIFRVLRKQAQLRNLDFTCGSREPLKDSEQVKLKILRFSAHETEVHWNGREDVSSTGILSVLFISISPRLDLAPDRHSMMIY